MPRKQDLADKVHDRLMFDNVVKYPVSVETRDKFRAYFDGRGFLVESVAEAADDSCTRFNYYLLIREKKIK